MAYLMTTLITNQNMLQNPTYDSNMVAERTVSVGTLGEINMMADPSLPFDPVESERRVKQLIGEQVNKAFEALRIEYQTDLLALNAKFDTVKAAQDINDGVVKDVVSEQSQFVNVEFAGVKATFNQADDMVKAMNVTIQQLNTEINMLKATSIPTPPGIPSSADVTMKDKSVMEYKVVQNIEKLSSAPGDFIIWNLRFKNAMSQVNGKYKELLESTEKLRVQIPTYEYWEVQVNPGLELAIGSVAETTKLKRDLYTVLVEKCNNNQVIGFANDEEDGFYAFYTLYRSFKVTAGIGQIEKRDLIMHPVAAKKDSDNYDCIVSWEREVKEQEKLIAPEQRPLMSDVLKGAVLKQITHGGVKDYIKTHEAIKTYTELRADVLRMAMFTKTEENTHPQKAVPMDLNAIVKQLQDEMNSVSPVKQCDHHFNFGPSYEKKEEPTVTGNESDKIVAQIMAMVKGKGKGKGVECYNCGKTGHMAKDCWSKGGGPKGTKGGWLPKGDGKGGYPGKGSYPGKGGPPRDGCFICGGPHWAKDCPKGKGKGKGVNGVEDPEKTTSGEMSLGGGKGGDQAQVEWDYQQQLYGQLYSEEFYAIDYGHEWLQRPTTQPQLPKINAAEVNPWMNVDKLKKNRYNKLDKAIVNDEELRFEKDCAVVNSKLIESIDKVKATVKQSQEVILNVTGAWEKITFTGDSGAVDHVITPEAGKAFQVKETKASRNGLTYRAANGTPIQNYGEKKLVGLTNDSDGFKMTCQVTDVKKNLASFVKMVNEGNDIILSQRGSYIKNVPSGKVIKMNLENGTPQFDVWVKKADKESGELQTVSEDEVTDSEVSAFQRLEMHI